MDQPASLLAFYSAAAQTGCDEGWRPVRGVQGNGSAE